MASEWITGLFGAGGAAIGAAATLTANWITSRGQQKLEGAKRSAANEDIRRAACSEYLSAIYTLMDSAHEVIRVCRVVGDQHLIEEAHREYLAAWKATHAKCGPVVAVGPRDLADLANDVRDHLAYLGGATDAVYTATRQAKRLPAKEKFDDTSQSAHLAVRDFENAVIQHFSQGGA